MTNRCTTGVFTPPHDHHFGVLLLMSCCPLEYEALIVGGQTQQRKGTAHATPTNSSVQDHGSGRSDSGEEKSRSRSLQSATTK